MKDSTYKMDWSVQAQYLEAWLNFRFNLVLRVLACIQVSYVYHISNVLYDALILLTNSTLLIFEKNVLEYAETEFKICADL